MYQFRSLFFIAVVTLLICCLCSVNADTFNCYYGSVTEGSDFTSSDSTCQCTDPLCECVVIFFVLIEMFLLPIENNKFGIFFSFQKYTSYGLDWRACSTCEQSFYCCSSELCNNGFRLTASTYAMLFPIVVKFFFTFP